MIFKITKFKVRVISQAEEDTDNTYIKTSIISSVTKAKFNVLLYIAISLKINLSLQQAIIQIYSKQKSI